MPSRVRRGLAVLLAAALLPVLSACGASFGAATQDPYTPADGVWIDNGAVKLRNLVLVSTATNETTLVGTIFNDGTEADALTAVSAGGQAGRMTPARVPLPDKGTAVLGADTSLGKASTVVLSGRSLQPGLTVRLTFDFERAASVTANVIVMPRKGAYETVPAPSPSPSPTIVTPSPTDVPQSEGESGEGESGDTASPEPTETPAES